MSYEHRSNVRIQRIPTTVKVTVVVSLCLLLLHLVAPTLAPRLGAALARPFWNMERNIRGEPVPASAELEGAFLEELMRENMELKKLFARTGSSTPLLAYVLKKPPFTAYDSFIIDVGSQNGVGQGDRVYAVGNVLLGEISDLETTSSKVRLYSSPGEKYEISINTTGTSTITTVAFGRGGGAFEASLPRDVKVKEYDTITIPSLSPSVFGIVKKVVADPARTFSTVLFSQPVNIYEQAWVLVEPGSSANIYEYEEGN